MNFYQRPWSDIVQELGSDSERGLSESQVKEQKRIHGLNAIPEKPPKSWVLVFIDQFKDPLIYLLLFAAVIIFFVSDHPFDAFLIGGILIFNAGIGTWQEGRTRSIMRSLRVFDKMTTVIFRNGQKELVDDKELVPGDIILLQEGQRVPADARIIESNNLLVNEAVLTGESLGVRKDTHEQEGELTLGDQINMLFKGTTILSGTGRAIIVAIGSKTVLGSIHKAVEESEPVMPLKKEVLFLSKWILVFVIISCVLIFGLGLLFGNPIKDLLAMTVALFICAVPEGLPIVFTLALVNGVYRMAKEGVLVKQMQSVEVLGRTDVIVIDKTGTLTRNEMMVTRVLNKAHDIEVDGDGYHVEGNLTENEKKVTRETLDESLHLLAVASCLLDNSEISYDKKQRTYSVKGDPTESAMAIFSQKIGMNIDELSKEYKKLYEIPFDPALRFHAGFYEHKGQGVCFVIGSFETVVQGVQYKEFYGLYDKLLEEGLRVLAASWRTFSIPASEPYDPFIFYKEIATKDLVFLGVVGIIDAIRTDVAEVVEKTRAAGIHVAMATGDHKRTALMVAEKVGIFKEGDAIIDGVSFRSLSDEEALEKVDKITVYARVDPMDKARIVSLFYAENKLVAMTGDGVNDVPSIVAADIGIAMGGIGTEVAKDAADLVLLNDSFSSIIKAIEQGRHIFYTLRRVILYFLTTNVAEIVMVLSAMLLQLPLPLTAPQILWLNLATDGFLDMSLAMEPKEQDILLQPGWLARKKRLIDGVFFTTVSLIALPMGFIAMSVFMAFHKNDLAHARTLALVTMAMAQWFNAWNCRSEKKSLFSIPLFSNHWLLVATILIFFLQLALVYIPFMQTIFRTTPLSFFEWLLAIGLTAPLLIIGETRKWFIRRAERRLV